MPGEPGFRRGQAELPRTPARRVPQSPQGSSQNIDPGALMPNWVRCYTHICALSGWLALNPANPGCSRDWVENYYAFWGKSER
jgi:hypothetical protein